ncbi:hypothetical protein BT69DRAFT_1353709 [Atractiella rhizophila]|nr:hypothetical protein BT69DRAFT_1353709 [Atractiella rhizophila]
MLLSPFQCTRQVVNLWVHTAYSRKMRDSQHRYLHLYSCHPSEFTRGGHWLAYHQWKHLHLSLRGLGKQQGPCCVLPPRSPPIQTKLRTRGFVTLSSSSAQSAAASAGTSASSSHSKSNTDHKSAGADSPLAVDHYRGAAKGDRSHEGNARANLCKRYRHRHGKMLGVLAMDGSDGYGDDGSDAVCGWTRFRQYWGSSFYWTFNGKGKGAQANLLRLLNSELSVGKTTIKEPASVWTILPRLNGVSIPKLPRFRLRIFPFPKQFRSVRRLNKTNGIYCPFNGWCPFYQLFNLPRKAAVHLQLREAGFFYVFHPLVAILKSSYSLQAITALSRFSLSLFPISAIASSWSRWPGARWVGLVLLLLPVLMSGAVLLSSLERTPITGRVRMVLLSEGEERELVHSVLAPSHVDGKSDWVPILKSVLGEDQDVQGARTLMGGRVLEEGDWRTLWVGHVLKRLEDGVPVLTPDGEKELDMPKLKYPLTPRLGGEKAAALYDVLVVERNERNAFSFGFGPAEWEGEGMTGGVIVVFTGFLDQILGPYSQAAPVESKQSFLRSIFGPIFYHSPPSLPSSPPPSYSSLPPLQADSALAVLLAHELSHLLLSHTLESYANNGQTFFHLRRMAVDIIRSATWPIVSILGPFFSDAISRSAQVAVVNGFNTGFEGLGDSCKSQMLEIEADLTSLRLLKAAGYDPWNAVEFWEMRAREDVAEGLGLPREAKRFMLIEPHAKENKEIREEGGGCEHVQSWRGRSHPVDEERIRRIRKELERWEREKEGVWTTMACG